MITTEEIIGKVKDILPLDINIASNIVVGHPLNRNRFYCDAMLVKDGRYITVIDISQNFNTLVIAKKKRILSQICYDKGIPYFIITDGIDALFADVRNEKYSSKLNLQQAIDKLKEQYQEKPENEETGQSLFNSVKKSAENKDLSLDGLSKDELLAGYTENVNGDILLSVDGEKALFKVLLGKVEESEICRYTSFHSLMRILNTKKASVCSIVGMNDKSECYYFDSYIENKGVSDFVTMSPSTVHELNSNFIMSCSGINRKDKLTMWRMYGDEAKGVCLVYKIDDMGSDFVLAPVSYANEDGSHPEIDFIKDLQENLRIVFPSLDVWKHFFKPFEYADENEIRLLYKDVNASNYKWIQATGDILCPIVEFPIEKQKNRFPLILKEVCLGPKCPEKEVNSSQLDMYANQLDIKYVGGQLNIAVSKIDNYR